MISHKDAELATYKEAIADYVEQADMVGMSYWVFVHEAKPMGLVFLGREPVRLLGPVGTLLSIIQVIDYEQPQEVFTDFTSKAFSIAKENAVAYAYADVPAKYSELLKLYEEKGFEDLTNSYRMALSLEGTFEPTQDLRFERVQRKDVNRFIDFVKECMSGSPDVMLNIILDQLQEIPEQFLDMWYQQVQLYFIYKNDQVIGILDLNPNGYINNIGVAPDYRNKGFGRQAMLFGLKTLKEGGAKEVRLRVDVKNKGAIHLYKSLGFNVADHYRTIIWRK